MGGWEDGESPLGGRRGESEDLGVGRRGPDLKFRADSTSFLEPMLSLLGLSGSRNLEAKLSLRPIRSLSRSLPLDPMLSLRAKDKAVDWRIEVGVGEGVPRDLSGLALEGGRGRGISELAIFSRCTEEGRAEFCFGGRAGRTGSAHSVAQLVSSFLDVSSHADLVQAEGRVGADISGGGAGAASKD